MSHIVVSCKCHIDAYNKIHLWSGIPHSYHCSHSISTRKNKELKHSAIGKALELTQSQQKRHISEYSLSQPRQTHRRSFLDQHLPPKEIVCICLGRDANAHFRDSTTLEGRIKNENLTSSLRGGCALWKASRKQCATGLPSFQRCANSLLRCPVSWQLCPKAN